MRIENSADSASWKMLSSPAELSENQCASQDNVPSPPCAPSLGPVSKLLRVGVEMYHELLTNLRTYLEVGPALLEDSDALC